MMQVGIALISLIIAIVAGILACKAYKANKRSAKDVLFNDILKQSSEAEARRYRGIVYKRINRHTDKANIITKIEQARMISEYLSRQKLTNAIIYEDKITADVLDGIAIENTLVTLDRVAYFLLDGKKLRNDVEIPVWLWNIVGDVGDRLYEYIKFKHEKKIKKPGNDTIEEENPEYNKNYVIYFKKLYEITPDEYKKKLGSEGENTPSASP